MEFVYKINCILKTWASLKEFKISLHSWLKRSIIATFFLGDNYMSRIIICERILPRTWKEDVKCIVYWNIYSIRDFWLGVFVQCWFRAFTLYRSMLVALGAWVEVGSKSGQRFYRWEISQNINRKKAFKKLENVSSISINIVLELWHFSQLICDGFLNVFAGIYLRKGIIIHISNKNNSPPGSWITRHYY